MLIGDFLRVAPGITCVVGSGGKTTLLKTLSEELSGSEEGLVTAATGGMSSAPSGDKCLGLAVILTTTTHFLPFEGIETLVDPSREDLARAGATRGVVCVGGLGKGGKLGAPATLSPAELAQTSPYVLVEADGSRQLPLKAHETWEPVIPEGSARTILVMGASGFGRPVREVVHRPELYCERTGASMDDPVRPEDLARLLDAEFGLGLLDFDVVLVNQAEDESTLEDARRLASHLRLEAPVLAGSLQKKELVQLR